MKQGLSMIGAGGALLAASIAAAKDDPKTSPLIDQLAKCLEIKADPERLACTDAAARKLIDASRRRDIVVVDKDEVKISRRSLFGFAVPNVGIFRAENGEELDAVDVKLTSATAMPYGKWRLALEDGAVWMTTEEWRGGVEPRAGTTVTIRKAALGSYMVSIRNGRAVRAMRTR